MPQQRNPRNDNLIKSLASKAELYLYKKKINHVNQNTDYAIYQKFWLTKSNLQFLISVFYDSELDEGFWGDRFNIGQISCSGTIHSNFFYQPPTNSEDITSLLLWIYEALYGDYEEEKEEAIKHLEDLFVDLSIRQGSTRTPFELLESLKNRTIFTEDFIQFDFHIAPREGFYTNTDDVNNQLIADKEANLVNPYVPNEFFENILMNRLGVDALTALANEERNPPDELAQARADYENTEYENIEQIDNAYNAPEFVESLEPDVRPSSHRYFLRDRLRTQQDLSPPAPNSEDDPDEIRPSQHRYFLRNRARVNYAPFLNRVGRHNRQNKIARGLGPKAYNIFKKLNRFY